MGELLTVLAALLAIAALAMAATGAATFLIVRRLIRRTRRSTRTAASAVQVRAAMLQVRAAMLPVGPRGEISRARCALRASLAHTARVLASQAVSGSGPNPFADLLIPLQHTAAELDARLALIDREPDTALRQALLPNLLSRTEQVLADSLALRQAGYGLADQVHSAVAEPLIADVRDRIVGLLVAIRDLGAVR